MATQICNLHGFNDINGGAHPSIKNFFNEILDKIKIQVDETYTGNNIILDTTWIHPSQINLVKFKTIYDLSLIHISEPTRPY